MKQIITGLVVLFSISFVHAQSYAGVKIYGFQQTVSGGKRPTAAINENNVAGNVAIPPRKNIWLYLVLPGKTVITPTELYLNGKKYSIKSERIVKTPVVYTDEAIPDEPKTTVMVPQTKGIVWMIHPLTAQKSTPSASLKKLISQNEAVVGYTVKGKKFYTSLKKFTWLEPALLQ